MTRRWILLGPCSAVLVFGLMASVGNAQPEGSGDVRAVPRPVTAIRFQEAMDVGAVIERIRQWEVQNHLRALPEVQLRRFFTSVDVNADGILNAAEVGPAAARFLSQGSRFYNDAPERFEQYADEVRARNPG